MAHSKSFTMDLRNGPRRRFSKDLAAPEPRKRRSSTTAQLLSKLKRSARQKKPRITKTVRNGASIMRKTVSKRESVRKVLTESAKSQTVATTTRRSLKRTAPEPDGSEEELVSKHRKTRAVGAGPDEIQHAVSKRRNRTTKVFESRGKPKQTASKVTEMRGSVVPDTDDEQDLQETRGRKRNFQEGTEETDDSDSDDVDLSSSRYSREKQRSAKRTKLSTEDTTLIRSPKTARRGKAAVKHSPKIQQMLAALPTHTPKLRKLTELISSQKWHDMDHIPSSIKKVCDNVPELIPSETCWKGGKPPNSALELVGEAVLNLKPDQYTIEDTATGTAKKKPIKDVITQLFDPPTEYPLIAHNVPTVEPKSFNTNAISDKVTPPSKQHIYSAMNVTPANTVVDIHVDQGTNGLSAGIGVDSDPWQIRVHKIWLFWPPTEYNLATYEKLKRSKSFRLLKMAQLEHGTITAFGIHHGVFIPAGWLHATITTRSGFLSGININSPSSLPMGLKIKAMDLRLAPWDISLHLYNLQDAIEVALDASLEDEAGSSVDSAIQGWYEVEAALRGIKMNAGRDRGPRAAILAAWMGMLEGREELDRRCCACWEGRREGEEVGEGCCSCRSKKRRFRRHFWEEHLAFLAPSKFIAPEFARKK